MGDLIQLDSYRSRPQKLERDRARLLVYEACQILDQLDEEEQRVAWMLEDCADMLGSSPKNTFDESLELSLESLSQFDSIPELKLL